ncbi:MAG: DUF4139 domain-containing protein [Bacteroidota bacterium]
MRRILIALLASTGLTTFAHAKDGRTTTVTVYTPGLALVEDTRSLDFAAGRSTIQFPDVSAQIRPETAALSADGVTVIEQNFDFDLLTPQKLMEKALGRTVKIVRTNPGSGAQVEEEATVLSTQQGVVLKVGDHIEVLRDDGVPTRVIFDKVPENLRARPTLSMLVASNRTATRPATLRYMTTGLTWKADYVATYNENAGTIDLQGWVTLTNATGVAYDDATVRVAAGAINGGNPSPNPGYYGRNDRGDMGANSRVTLFDLPERVTIADRQNKQIGMVELKGVKAEKVYRSAWFARGGNTSYSGTGTATKAQVVLRFDAKDGDGKVWRLPRGAIRGFIRDSKGDAQFIGETQINDIAAGGTVSAPISEAFDIEVQPRMVLDERLGSDRRRQWVEYKITNASTEDVSVEVEEGRLGPSVKVVSESEPGVALDAYRRQWVVKVPAKGSTTLTVTFELDS